MKKLALLFVFGSLVAVREDQQLLPVAEYGVYQEIQKTPIARQPEQNLMSREQPRCISAIVSTLGYPVRTCCPTLESQRDAFRCALGLIAIAGCVTCGIGGIHYASTSPAVADAVLGINMMIGGGASELGPIAGCIGLCLTEEGCSDMPCC